MSFTNLISRCNKNKIFKIFYFLNPTFYIKSFKIIFF